MSSRFADRLPRVSVALGAPPLSRLSQMARSGALNVTPTWALPQTIAPTVIPVRPTREQAVRLLAGGDAGFSYSQAAGLVSAWEEIWDAWSNNQGRILESTNTLIQQITAVLALPSSTGTDQVAKDRWQQAQDQWKPIHDEWQPYYEETRTYFNPDGTFKIFKRTGGATEVNNALREWQSRVEPFRQYLVVSQAAPLLKPEQPAPARDPDESMPSWLERNGKAALKWTAIGGATIFGLKLLFSGGARGRAPAKAMAGMRRRPRESAKFRSCLRSIERREPGAKAAGKAYAICQTSVNKRPTRRPGGRWP